MTEKRTFGKVFGGPVKYRWLVSKVQEYPVNKALLALAEKDIGPAPPCVREVPQGTYTARPTETNAVRLADLSRRVKEVETALETIPEEYREGVLYHTINHGNKGIGASYGSAWSEPYFDFAHKNTWKRWKTRFLLSYAEIIGEMDYIRLLLEYQDDLGEDAYYYRWHSEPRDEAGGSKTKKK